MAQETPLKDAGGKILLLSLCVIALVVSALAAADNLGLGGRPWYGWWDSNMRPVSPYVLRVSKPVPGGASDRAGLHDGDLIDLREQPIQTRVAVLHQLMATQPTALLVHRGASALRIQVTGSSSWEGATLWKIPTMLSYAIASLWFAGSALLIALRGSARRDSRAFAIVLLCISGTALNPSFFVVPSATWQMILLVVAQLCRVASALLLVQLASQFGKRSRWRSAFEWAARAAALLFLANDVVETVGVQTLAFDPTPFVDRVSTMRGFLSNASSVLVLLATAAAVRATAPAERPRAAWMLLPIPVAMFVWTVLSIIGVFVVQSWFAIVTFATLGDITWLLAAWLVTYAILKRRVLDLEFVLSRTLVVGVVSAIVVASFVLLEWLLGAVLVGVSHATGVVANAALALALGLSLNPIHKRVDAFVEASFFRKRHENERALLEFSKEAAYVTNSDALLDLAIDRIARHTDARDAAILLQRDGQYVTARSFGDGTPQTIAENDPMVLALKTWHKPVDPHHYGSAMRGALALPMLARGRLLGIVALDERAGGEAYAPDEVEALSAFTHGIASALDVLSVETDEPTASLREAMAAMARSIAQLGNETASIKRSLAG